MKITVLCDNNTYIDNYLLGEPALSFYIEDGNSKILFDTGYSDVFFRNAQKLNLDLSGLTDIVLSHGHNDHTGGLVTLIENGITGKHITVHALPGFTEPKIHEGLKVGSPVSEEELQKYYTLKISDKPEAITKKLTFLGEIPVSQSFEKRKAIGSVTHNGETVPDYMYDDSALCARGSNGIYIITGCSHSGICNICEYAKLVSGENNIAGITGGFHLFDCDKRLTETTAYFIKNAPLLLCPCHCVSFKAKAEINKTLPVTEIGSGYTVNY